MDTRKIAAEYRLAHWAQIMRERTESGLSISAFCKNSRISDNTYFYWQKKLREAACEQLAEMQRDSTQTGIIRQKFTEVKLRDNLSQRMNMEPVLQGNLCMEVSGVKIVTDSSYPVSQLAYLLRELVQ
jgi:hypothetical protein